MQGMMKRSGLILPDRKFMLSSLVRGLFLAIALGTARYLSLRPRERTSHEVPPEDHTDHAFPENFP